MSQQYPPEAMAKLKALLSENQKALPTRFKCDICGTGIAQSASDTQRRGWPICHGMNMRGETE